MAAKLRKGDEVQVIAGKDKGQLGRIVKVERSRIWVSGIRLVKRHKKPVPSANLSGEIVVQEASLHVSNLAIFNSTTQKADRVGFRFNEQGKKVRFFKSTKTDV